MKILPSSVSAITKSILWFFIGGFLALFLVISGFFILFQKMYANAVYPGVTIQGVNFGGKTRQEVTSFFAQKNVRIFQTRFIFTGNAQKTTISAGELNYGYNHDLLAQQAYSIGRSENILTNMYLMLQSYLNGVSLPVSYHYDENKLTNLLSPITDAIKVQPVDALFTFENGRVVAFRPSLEGQEVDVESVKNTLSLKAPQIAALLKPQQITIPLPIKKVSPKITTDQANKLGIKELLSVGTSLFQGSIPSRIHNITVAAAKVNGILVAPNEMFSFDKALGDVSQFTGYVQAYIIQNGRTVLGDGGGVCQVSTTFFRALLNAGLPITERSAHAYRVAYYEQDSSPGIDATIYIPSVDLKFKNDTDNYILIQTAIDPVIQRLTFFLYGAKDGREITMTQPVVTNVISAPEPLYQDDPTLPKGTIKQVDYAAAGATASFSRKVTKDGKVIISDKFVSNYRPWQAVYLRGTKE